MPMSQWPCHPESLSDIIEPDLIRFIIAGAAEKYRLPIVLIDEKLRYDSFNPRQQASWFCRRLRGGEHEEHPNGILGADVYCESWDISVAGEALSDCQIPLNEPQLLPCWLNLSNFLVKSEVAHYPFIFFTGQIIPKTNSLKTKQAIEKAITEKLSNPASGIQATPQDIKELKRCLKYHRLADDEIINKLKSGAEDILSQFQKHWELRLNTLEGKIYSQLVTQAQSISVAPDNGNTLNWSDVDELLANLCKWLGCRTAVLFTHRSNHGQSHPRKHNVLELCSSFGLEPQLKALNPHFNWNKSRISRYGETCLIGSQAQEVINDGVRGFAIPNPFSFDLLYPVDDELTNCRTLIGLSGFQNLELVRERIDFLEILLSRISRRLQGLQLYSIAHHAVEFNREISEFLAHQVRSRLQSFIGFQKISLDFSHGKASLATFERASAHVTNTIGDLATLSQFIQQQDDEPVLYDPDNMKIERKNPWLIIEEAIEDQSMYARARNIEIKVEQTNLPGICVDPFWFRTMLGHILNNAIKYSRNSAKGRLRWIQVNAEQVNPYIHIFIENFGLGILEDDKSKIFERGITASERGHFDRTGQRRGLYEAQRIAIAHDTKIEVVSMHYSQAPVRLENIEECITTFIIKVPFS